MAADMTGRSVKAWAGKTPDTPIPPRVRLRVFERAKGCCEACGRKLRAGDTWQADHTQALTNGGENSEANLRCVCDWCHKAKTAADVAEKARTARVKKKHLGLAKPKRQPSPFKKKVSGEVVWRATGEPVNG